MLISTRNEKFALAQCEHQMFQMTCVVNYLTFIFDGYFQNAKIFVVLCVKQ